MKNYYEILGVSKSASQPDIDKAFRSLSRKYHPDLNQDDPDRHNKFTAISEAYQTLSDPALRRKYDAKLMFGGGGGPRQGPYGPHYRQAYYHDFDPYSHFWRDVSSKKDLNLIFCLNLFFGLMAIFCMKGLLKLIILLAIILNSEIINLWVIFPLTFILCFFSNPIVSIFTTICGYALYEIAARRQTFFVKRMTQAEKYRLFILLFFFGRLV